MFSTNDIYLLLLIQFWFKGKRQEYTNQFSKNLGPSPNIMKKMLRSILLETASRVFDDHLSHLNDSVTKEDDNGE